MAKKYALISIRISYLKTDRTVRVPRGVAVSKTKRAVRRKPVLGESDAVECGNLNELIANLAPLFSGVLHGECGKRANSASFARFPPNTLRCGTEVHD